MELIRWTASVDGRVVGWCLAFNMYQAAITLAECCKPALTSNIRELVIREEEKTDA